MDELSKYLGPPKRRVKTDADGQLSMFNTHHDDVFSIDVYRFFIDAVTGGRWKCTIYMQGHTDPVYLGKAWQSKTTAIHEALNALVRGKTLDRKEVPQIE